MTPEAAIRSLLIAGVDGLSVFPNYAPQGHDKPYAIIARNATEVDHHMGGASGLRKVMVDLWIYSKDYAAVQALASECETTLDTVNDRTTVGGLDIGRLWIEEQSDEGVQIADGTGKPVHGIKQLYGVYYHGN